MENKYFFLSIKNGGYVPERALLIKGTMSAIIFGYSKMKKRFNKVQVAFRHINIELYTTDACLERRAICTPRCYNLNTHHEILAANRNTIRKDLLHVFRTRYV
jgi:hypothetical protein